MNSSPTWCDTIFHLYSSLLLSWATHERKTDINCLCSEKIFQFFSSSHWRKRQRQVWIIPENWTIGFIWCLQDASPSVGDVGVVGETMSGFREILSNSAWTSVKTGFWPTKEMHMIQSRLWNSSGKACGFFNTQEAPVKLNNNKKKMKELHFCFRQIPNIVTGHLGLHSKDLRPKINSDKVTSFYIPDISK